MTVTALVTGGGSGIGAATARRLVRSGHRVVLAGRRPDPLHEVAREIGEAAQVLPMDVTDPASVAAAVAGLDALDVVVHNAGGALGADRVEDGRPEEWREMFESNVLGVLHVTQAVLPLLRRSEHASIVVVTSIAGHLVYEGGAGYTAAKHAEHAVTQTLRLELSGEPIRVIEILPGMVQTERFSLVRYRGDQSAADAVYAGVDRPLVAADVAECIGFALDLPHHVNVDQLVVKPVAQAAPHKVHRGPLAWHRGAEGTS